MEVARTTGWLMTTGVDGKLKDVYMLSQYRRALPFHPQCGTVGMNPRTLFTVLVTVLVYPKYLVKLIIFDTRVSAICQTKRC